VDRHNVRTAVLRPPVWVHQRLPERLHRSNPHGL
jgi:hypothetical protein